MRYRFTRIDWQIINSALALLEAELDEASDEQLHGVSLRRLEQTRAKVHDRLDRYERS